ncbi:MAG: hypothetical protein D6741_18860, partial [Planctomycetota bacterium]
MKHWLIVWSAAWFVGLPLLFYYLGDVPARTVLKEAISLTTLLAFSLMLGQFYLARSNMRVIELFDLRRVKKLHTVIAYSAVTALLLHPLAIVVPRYFEAGVDPLEAFTTMITTVQTPGIFFGLIAWVLLAVLTVTSFFRFRVIRALHISYPHWRHFHGMLGIMLTVFAVLHAILLGRHMIVPMRVFVIVTAVIGAVMLLRMYRPRHHVEASVPARQ